MLWAIAIVLASLWVLGLVTSNTFGGAVHVLAVVALTLAVVGYVQTRWGRRLR